MPLPSVLITSKSSGDASLDPGKLRNLIVKGGGLRRATPDMRLVRLFKEPGGDGLARAERMLEELAKLEG